MESQTVDPRSVIHDTVQLIDAIVKQAQAEKRQLNKYEMITIHMILTSLSAGCLQYILRMS